MGGASPLTVVPPVLSFATLSAPCDGSRLATRVQDVITNLERKLEMTELTLGSSVYTAGPRRAERVCVG
jgi:hypothetical protein